jgi:GntR family transcriptional repressor for pyruvate dehydrogenase complex
MRATADQMQTNEPTVGEEADWAFHYQIAQAADNPFVRSLIDTIADQMKGALAASRQTLFRIPGEAERLRQQHVEILRAIADRDEAGAASAMLAHLTHVEARLEVPEQYLPAQHRTPND